MSLVKRDRLCDSICTLAGIRRDLPGARNFSKRELLLLHSHLNLVNDLVKRFQSRKVESTGGTADGRA